MAYCLYYRHDGYNTIDIEKPFELPLLNPTSDTFIEGASYNGILDAVLEKGGRIAVCDHKTASSVSSTYWEGLKSDPQLTLYCIAALQMGIEIDHFLWDVIVKPGISPKTITKAARKELDEFGSYCGHPYPEKDWMKAEKETPKMYGLRVFVEYTENPKKYFHRREVTRPIEELEDLLKDMCVVDSAMRRTDAVHKALKNRTHCKSFNSMCDFHNKCFGDGSGYRPRESRDVPFSSESRSISSINTFLNCRRKWYYQKVEKIEPVRQEYKDSLHIGSMFHKGLEMFLASKPSKIKLNYQGNLCTQDTFEDDSDSKED